MSPTILGSSVERSSQSPQWQTVRELNRIALTRLLSSASWLMLENAVRLGTAFVVTIWVARYLGPGQFGELAFAIAFTRLFSEASTLGLNGLLVREFVRKPDSVNSIVGTSLLMRGTAGLLSAAASIGAAALFAGPESQTIIMVAILAVAFPLRASETIEQHALSQNNTRAPSIARMMGTVSYGLATVAMLLLEAPLVWFAVAKTVEVVATSAAFWLQFRRPVVAIRTMTYSLATARSLLSSSWPLILSGLGATLNLRIGQIMLSRLASDYQVGIFAAAANISEALYFLPVAVVVAAFPKLVALKERDPEAYVRALQLAFDSLVWLGFLIAAAVSLLSPVIVGVAYGPEYADASRILTVHVWACVFVFGRAVLSKWILIHDVTRASLLTHGLGSLTNIVANLLLIPKMGGLGAAIASLLGYMVSSYLALFAWKPTIPAAIHFTRSLVAPWRTLDTLTRKASK